MAAGASPFKADLKWAISGKRSSGLSESAFVIAVSTWEGMERDMIGLYKAKLLQEWIPAMPEGRLMLEKGVKVADIGCGTGRILVMLAQAFPKSRYVGIDIFQPLIDRARSHAETAGVSDVVQYEVGDASLGLPDRFGRHLSQADPQGRARVPGK